jgi:hypothetical protein
VNKRLVKEIRKLRPELANCAGYFYLAPARDVLCGFCHENGRGFQRVWMFALPAARAPLRTLKGDRDPRQGWGDGVERLEAEIDRSIDGAQRLLARRRAQSVKRLGLVS